VPDLARQVAALWVDALAFAGEHAGDGILRQPVDLDAGHQLAQLARDRHVALGVAEADRRRDVEDTLPVRRAPRYRGRHHAVEELAQREVHRDGLSRLHEVPRAFEGDQRATGDAGESLAVGVRRDVVVAAVDDEHRAAHAPRQRELALAVERRACEHAGERDGRRRIGVVSPGDAVLDLLGRVWLGEALRHPPGDEVGVVGAPVAPVELAESTRGERPLRDSRVIRGWQSSRQCSERNGLTGKNGPMNAAPSTRSGCSAARRSARCAPRDRLTRNARSTPFASITASASFTNSSSVYARSPAGRSDLPLPRGSKVSTRERRAKFGICAFQQRE
jgi:hypothetical protein